MSKELLINLRDYLLGTLSPEDIIWLGNSLIYNKNNDTKEPLKRDTLEEYCNLLEEGRLQAETGKYCTTEELFKMCGEEYYEEELETEAV
ncbi:MAG: hypothetical protein IIU03_07145 [Bacteroidales bacterium]|nr:hypothetical protein [Bacteroidales bacterium]